MPVLATRGTPWERLIASGAGWWVSPTTEGIADGLRSAFAITPEQRAVMGDAGKRLARDELQWSAVGRRMLECYQWLFDRRRLAPSAIALK